MRRSPIIRPGLMTLTPSLSVIMDNVSMRTPSPAARLMRRWPVLLLGLVMVALVGCNEEVSRETSADGSSNPPSPATGSGDFSVQLGEPQVSLQEGASDATRVAVTLTRSAGFDGPVELSVAPVSPALGDGFSAVLSQTTLASSENSSTLELSLAIDTLPRQRTQADLTITATSGAASASSSLAVNVEPVQAPDVYLLIGQSNMVGFSGDQTRLSGPGQPDEPDPRILQLHVSANDSEDVFVEPEDFTSVANNVVLDQPLIQALDPLHEPLDEDGSGKDDAYIGPGLSFAKAALPNTSQPIVLVPAAWSSTAFCLNVPAPENGQLGGWNPVEPSNPVLGNTLMFDRALTRVNTALDISGGILRGILWHQGETDSNERCASLYEDNLRLLISELRSRINVDAAGERFRGPDAPVPFLIGTMSRGADERGDLSEFPPEKQLVDSAHRTLAAELPYAGLANLDDLVPPAYPCGNTTCIHFGPEALRVAGQRYYEALRRAVGP